MSSARRHRGADRKRESVTAQPTESANMPRERWLIAGLVLVSAVLFLRTLNLPLHYSDDVVYLSDPRLSSLSLHNIWAILSTSFLANYHPITTFTYLFDRTVFGSWLPGYHATHLAFYLVGVFLVYRLLSRLLTHTVIAWTTAAVFAAHTLHVEVVAWLAQRKDVVVLVFYVGSLLAYMRYVDTDRRSWRAYAATLGLALFAMLSKGYAVVLPGIFFAYDLCYSKPSGRRWLLDKIPVVLLAATVTAATLLAQDKDSALMAAEDLDITVPQRAIALGMVLAAYVGRTLLPVDLSFSYAVGPFWLSLPVALLGALLAGAGLVAFVKLRRLVPGVAFGIALWVLPLTTVLNVFWTLATWMNDRYLFLPTIGSSLVLATAAQQLLEHRSVPRWILGAAAASMLVTYGALTQARIGVWNSEVLLRSDALRQQLDLPGDGLVTAAHIRQARVTVLPNINAYFSLIEAYERAGDNKRANDLKGVFNQVSEGGDMESKLAIAKQEIDAGQLDHAIARLLPAAESHHWHAAEAWTLIGRAHEKGKRPEQAGLAYREALKRLEAKGMSTDAVMLRLGAIDLEAGRTAEAIAWYERATAASDPNDPRARFRLAQALEQAGRLEEAYANCLKALSTEGSVPPTVAFNFVDLRVSAALIAEKLNRHRDALNHLQAASSSSTDPAQLRKLQVKRALLTETGGDLLGALSILEGVLGDPALDERAARLIQAAELAEKLKQPTRAIGHLRTLLNDFPKHPERPQIILKVGLLAEQAGDIATAIQSYNQALELAPNYQDAEAVRARIALLKAR